jgi:hypothetical protein
MWLFAIYPGEIRVALHYEWLSLKQGPFIDSWDGQFALIMLCSSIFYLARATLSRNALRRTADNKALQLTAR